MKGFTRKFFSRLLIFILIINPVQITIASDFDQHSGTMNCQVSQERVPGATVKIPGDGCKPDNQEHCSDISVCVMHNNLSAFYSNNSFLLVPRAFAQKKFVPENETVSTQYPDLLKRPPKV